MTIRLYDKDVNVLDFFSAVVKPACSGKTAMSSRWIRRRFSRRAADRARITVRWAACRCLDAHDVRGEVEHLVSTRR